MQSLLRIMASFLLLSLYVIPASTFAGTINMYQEPRDQSKVTGIVDLSKGVIPIYVPQNSEWTKIADPRNGNTGWVKNNELKDSKGKIITFSQQVSDNGNEQTIQLMQSSGQVLTPEQKKKLDAQLQQQQQTAKETLIKAQKSVAEVMDGLKKMYQQQLEILQESGFPTLMPATTPQQSNQGPQPALRQPGMNQMQGPQSYPQQGMQPMQGPPPSGMMPPAQLQNRNNSQQTNQMPQPGSGKATGTY